MDTMHPSVKYGLFLAVLAVFIYGAYGLQIAPNDRAPTVIAGVVIFSLIGLVGRKLAKDPFVGFVSAVGIALGLSLIGTYAI